MSRVHRASMLRALVVGFALLGSVGVTAAPASAYQASGRNGRVAWATNADGDFDIWTMNPYHPSDRRKLTNNSEADYQPEWSPNGQQIAYVHETGGIPEIWVMNANGSSPHAVYTGSWAWKPTWSPDGTKIAFAYKANGDRKDIGVVLAASGAFTRLTNHADDTQFPTTTDWPSWSPDGTKIAVAEETYYPLTNETDQLIRVLTNTGLGFEESASVDARRVSGGLGQAGGLWHPAWAPDSKGIAYEKSDTTWSAVLEANNGVSHSKSLTSGSAWQGFVAWSPDGKLVASFGSPTDLFVKTVDDATVQRLTSDAALDNDPSWTKDNTRPTVALTGPASTIPAGTKYVVWTASDYSNGVGIKKFRLRFKRAKTGGTFSDWSYPTAWQSIGGTRRAYAVAFSKGYTYCFSIAAVDWAGNWTAWSGARCTKVT